jgi:hypothetical protein
MGLLGFLRKGAQTHSDPELGELVFDRRSSFWEGTTPFSDAREPADVSIAGDAEGPSPHTRAAFFELRDRYPSLRGAITAALFELYDNFRSDATEEDYEEGLPRLTAPEQIWGTTSLDDITVWWAEAGNVHIEITYTFEWHEDHMFAVQIDDWQVAGVSIDG